MRFSADSGNPRIVTAGLAGDSGKTFVSLGLIRTLSRKGARVAAFKKGPDFIDAAWLGRAAVQEARNLDTFLMPRPAILSSFVRSFRGSTFAVIEGNRGLFDGLDEQGSHSTAELAKLLQAPVILVVDTTKVTRTVAALVKGCCVLDPAVSIAGVVLNKVGTSRQESLICRAIQNEVGLPVVGAIPRLREEWLPSRHLGLITSAEHPRVEQILEFLADTVDRHVDVERIVELGRDVAPLIDPSPGRDQAAVASGLRIGVLSDSAFLFYYPENLEALAEKGAELVYLSPLSDQGLPEIHALYAGGGFPEVHAKALSSNRTFRRALRQKIDQGLPVWAECGGLMYLGRSLNVDGQNFPMVGALPIDVEHTRHPQGHGYVEALVDRRNAFFHEGTELVGHEFHYSRLIADQKDVNTVLQLRRGSGIGGKRDGIQIGSVFAAYTHLHAAGTPDWSDNLIRVAKGGLN